MRFTSPSRRALGLLAASTIAMSTAVLGVAGVASAAPFITSDDGESASSFDGDEGLVVPAGYCYAFVQVTGASGGGQDSSSAVGGDPESVEFYVTLEGGEVFEFAPGGEGQAQSGPVTDGAGGVNATDSTLNGTAGDGAGGGGAGSALYLDGAVLAVASGGDGAQDAETTGGVGGGTSAVAASAALMEGRDVDIAQAEDWNGEGAVSISAIGCDAPFAPFVTAADAGDGEATVFFNATEGSDYTADPSGFEYSTDGTTWTALTQAEIAAETFTVDGLTNGTEYSVTMRATTEANGPSESSDAVSVTPYAQIGAVTGLAVTRGVSSVTVTWNAPTEAGTFPLAGYDVGWSGGEFGSQACALDSTVRTCFISFPAGTDYLVTAYAVDSEGNLSEPARIQSGVIAGPAVPSSVPTKDDGDIVGPAGPITSVTAGQKLTLVGSGFAPNSTVQLTVFSAPVSLGTVVADENGAFSVEVTLPANLTNGTHYLAATGINPDGSTRNLVIAVTVSGGVVTGATLANTGVDTAVPLAGGAFAVLAGVGLLVGARRRSTV